jgi:hypothetical protein
MFNTFIIREFLTAFSVLALVLNVDSYAMIKIGTARISRVNRARTKYFEAFSFYHARISKLSFKQVSSNTSARYSSISDFMASEIFLTHTKSFKPTIISVTLLLAPEQ